jgi:hypothetical protein
MMPRRLRVNSNGKDLSGQGKIWPCKAGRTVTGTRSRLRFQQVGKIPGNFVSYFMRLRDVQKIQPSSSDTVTVGGYCAVTATGVDPQEPSHSRGFAPSANGRSLLGP